MVAANGVALFAALQAVHGSEAVADMSNHYMASEISRHLPGMLIVLPAEEWKGSDRLEHKELAECLREIARAGGPGVYKKATRGPKKPPSEGIFKSRICVSTHKLIEASK